MFFGTPPLLRNRRNTTKRSETNTLWQRMAKKLALLMLRLRLINFYKYQVELSTLIPVLSLSLMLVIAYVLLKK